MPRYRSERSEVENVLTTRTSTLRRRIALRILEQCTKVWVHRQMAKAWRVWTGRVHHVREVLARVAWRKLHRLQSTRNRGLQQRAFQALRLHATANSGIRSCSSAVVLRGTRDIVGKKYVDIVVRAGSVLT